MDGPVPRESTAPGVPSGDGCGGGERGASVPATGRAVNGEGSSCPELLRVDLEESGDDGAVTPPALEGADRLDVVSPVASPRTTGWAARQHRWAVALKKWLLGLPDRPGPRLLRWSVGILAGITGLVVAYGLMPVGTETDPPERPARSEDTVAAGLARYFDDNGGRPELFPSEDGLFGFSLGSPVEDALAQLGPELSRSAGSEGGSVTRRWKFGTMAISVLSDRVGSVSSMVDPATASVCTG